MFGEYYVQEIPSSDFLTIFVSSGLVILFGMFYVAVYTLVKMKKIHSFFMPIGYLFWIIQTYCLFLLSETIRSEPFTQKVLMAAMVGYLFIPHFIYFLLVKTHEKYEH